MATDTAAGLELSVRMEGLGVALTAGEGRLDPAATKRALDFFDQVGERLRVGADRTVVALVGGTGSGKSSLFNALAGMDVAEVGVRRPTTGLATACVWSEGADALLDWLGVPPAQRTDRESVLDGARQGDLHGLVLLDLPDHDSVVVGHQLEVDRLVSMVDLLIWVVDPQKYADEALHAGYLRKLTGHQAVMLVVLNQVDKLTPFEAQTCADDLRRLLNDDGLGQVAIVTTSARTGAGVDELREVLAEAVQQREAFATRVTADVLHVVDDLRPGLGAGEPDPARLPGADTLVPALAEAAGVPAVLDAVAAGALRRITAATDWPPLLWARRGDRRPAAPEVVLSPAQRSRVEQAIQTVTDGSERGLPQPWADAIREAPATDAELGRALDDAVASVDLVLPLPGWVPAVRAGQLVAVLLAVVGLVWSVVALVAGGSAGSPVLALAVLVLGLALGAGLTVGAHRSARTAVQQDIARLSGRMDAAIGAVATERVIGPVAAVVSRHRAAREALGG